MRFPPTRRGRGCRPAAAGAFLAVLAFSWAVAPPAARADNGRDGPAGRRAPAAAAAEAPGGVGEGGPVEGAPVEGGPVDVPEEVYRTDLIAFPGPWAFWLGQSGVVLVSDRQLVDLAEDPDRPVNVSLSAQARMDTLRGICERARARGHRTLAIAFDYFFAQYRTDARDQPRTLWPDTKRYVELVGKIGRFAQGYGLGIELSLLSPLEIGRGYREATGEAGRWYHWREGLRDGETGAYSVQLWRQLSWTNNKGTIRLEPTGVRVFAFRERRIAGTAYHVVDPGEIVEITETAKVEVFEGLRAGRRPPKGEGRDSASLAGYSAVRVRVHGAGRADIGPLDRVLVVQSYRTPEMDYFSSTARPFLRGLVDEYVEAGVRINALYADETHIQGDWTYFGHHDHGAFALRYVSPGFERAFARRYGERYADFARWLVYFASGQHDTANDLTARSEAMHVLGASAADVRRTALLRARYYELLQGGVVDLFLGAERYLEERMGHQIHSRAHATWAESPTIDAYREGPGNAYAEKYEYTSSFLWSNSVHQAATACHDLFAWGDFLHGTGNDTAEGGWLDRDYEGFAMASSLGVLNRIRNAYAAHWGMPAEVSRRRSALRDAWGTWPSWPYGIVENMEHRQTEVLMLYPLDLVAAGERFGSWMTQYAYANRIPEGKLLELARVSCGAIEVAGRRYTTLVAAFEPLPRPGLWKLLEELARSGGRVVWSGPPPVVDREGRDALARWEALTKARYRPTAADGVPVPGRLVEFSGALEGISPMTILTDLLPDRIYPLEPLEGAEAVARVGGRTVGTLRRLEGGGSVVALGFRPRDDQSASMGFDERHWFEILRALGGYAPSGTFPGVEDNPEAVARTTRWFTARFPNGALSVAPHLRRLEEAWPGGFHRDREADARVVARLALPSERVELDRFTLAGHRITYRGAGAMVFRVDAEGNLIAFAGRGSDRIEVDGRETVFAERPLPLVAWAPVEAERRVEGGALLLVRAAGEGELRLPAPGFRSARVVREGATPGSRGASVESRLEEGRLRFRVGGGAAWYYVLAAE